jgi:hypothetical protein
MSELTHDQEIALVTAATLAVLRTQQAPAPSAIIQDSTDWRFQNRWWAQGPLATRARPNRSQ